MRDDIKIIGKSLFLKKTSTLILGDIHIGLESAMNQNGLLIPRFQYEDLKKTTREYIKKTSPKQIVLNGDIKHEFGKITKQEWKQTEEYIKILNKKAKLHLIEGNHDKLLKIITEKLGLELKKYFYTDGFFITHGDELIKNDDYEKAHTVIIGHDHPAISLQEGGRQETYKCFLEGKYEDKNLIMMPSMHEISEGTDILKENIMSPYIKKINDFKVHIVGEKTMEFGKLKDLKKII